MFMVISVPTIYPACHTDDNTNKQGSNLTVADKRVAELSKAEYWDIKSVCYVRITRSRMFQQVARGQRSLTRESTSTVTGQSNWGFYHIWVWWPSWS